MPFTKIVPADLQGKGVIGQPPVPGLSVNEMQESVEQVVREVAIPAVNRLIDELEATSAGGNVGMEIPAGMPPETPENVQGVVQSHIENTENPHGVTAEQVGAYTKAETDQAIDEKVQAIGAADMSKAEFATSGEYGVVDKAKAAETAESATESADGVKVYTHSKSGTVHEFSGDGPNGRAKMTADVSAGDTFTVNGAPVTAFIGANDAASTMAGNPWTDKWILFTIQDGTLNFHDGYGVKPILVWSNASPDNNFAPQTIELDLSGFSHVLVEGKQASGNRFTSSVLIPVGGSSGLSLLWQSGGKLWAYERAVIVKPESVQFGNGEDVTSTSVSTNNAVMVPQRIWGIGMQ